MKNWLEIFLISLRLGLTSFGGPVAHLGYFHEEYVKRRAWLTEKQYADLVALCQFLPGPASSQVGIGIGMVRGGVVGGFISFTGFTMPSVLLLMAVAVGFQQQGLIELGIIDGLKIVAVAVVAHALLGMGRNLAPDKERATIAVLAFTSVLLVPSVWIQVVVILTAGLLGWRLYRNENLPKAEGLPLKLPLKLSVVMLGLFGGLLALLPVLRAMTDHLHIQLADSFYRAGALVFGGGHVVLPLLEREIVPAGLMSESQFLAGYGAAQAVPGPLFTFASYLGMVIDGVPGAVTATAAVFLPAFLLLLGVLPIWLKIQQIPAMLAAVTGVNAAVVGILAAALYSPVFTSAILEARDMAFAGLLFMILVYWKRPAWVAVILGILGGLLFYGG
ncbi:chromate efflux transporter [Salisediminibacterium beveridgei]|uniref:Transporter, chromate ion transporter family n=1 Tax=Salisediminibacterium beveridgei TaxID=632773 RepID=A0A1D7QY49_9BACI|nr:chromate efflux transporter [Salisediminibacterium beveridgei]AOM83937.1 transporter, chromate ion transporter family [Salisediminibacterium beveridgei]